MTLANYKKILNKKEQKFLEYFPQTLFCYIPDFNKNAPVIHSEELDLEKQGQGYGTFFTVNGFTGGKRTGETLTNINAFFCDIDYPDKINKTAEGLREYKNDLLMELVTNELPIPTFINETKNGLHVFWILEQPIYLNNLNPQQREELLLQYRTIEEAILNRFDGDPGAKDVARVLRVPGTIHQKDPNDPFECKLIQFAPDECSYTFAEIREAFLKNTPADGWAIAHGGGENAIDREAKKLIEKEYPRLDRPSYKKLFSKEPGSVPEGMRNKALLVAAYAAKEAGWTFDQVCQHFTVFHGLGLREIRKTIRSAFEHDYDFGYNNEVMQAIVDADERVKLSEVTSKVLSKTTKGKRDEGNEAQKKKYETYEYIIADRYPHIKYKIRGDFYDYSEGLYKPMQVDDFRSIMFREMLKDGLMNYRKVSAANDKIATFKSLEGRTFYHEDENPDENILNFKNGLLNIKDYTLREHTPEYLSTSQIPIMYNKGATCPLWMKFLDDITCNDPGQMRLLQQIAGYCLTNDTKFAKAFIFYGMGANGKSLFTRMLSKIIGSNNVSSLNLTTITKQFGLTGLIGKKVNLIDEISGHYFESNVIKGIISGERVAAEVKYRPEPIEFIPIVKLIFSVNELPKINDTTPGLYRRFIIVPFDRSFESNPDLFLEEKLSSELTGILNWAIEGLKDLRNEKGFFQTERNHEMMRLFKSDNSPLVEFVNFKYQPAPQGSEHLYPIPFVDFYSDYREYCFDHGYKPKSVANFTRELSHNRFDGFNIKKEKTNKGHMVFGIRRLSTPMGEQIVYPDTIKTP